MLLKIFLRMLLALGLGFAIGFERKKRFKEAGIRTHTIVCLGACLYTIISKYGFTSADSARVAAQIVPGIGFIGAGIIFYHKEVVHGLTTAAGIWATAAIGMACGAGMYAVAAIASGLIVVIQWIMHINIPLFRTRRIVKINVTYKDPNGENGSKVKKLFGVKGFSKLNAKRDGEEMIYVGMVVAKSFVSCEDMYKILKENDYILAVTLEDDTVS